MGLRLRGVQAPPVLLVPDDRIGRADALRYLTLVEAQIAQGEWTDPVRAKVRLSDYAERWISERPGLRPRTVEFYQSLLRRHVTPWLGDC